MDLLNFLLSHGVTVQNLNCLLCNSFHGLDLNKQIREYEESVFWSDLLEARRETIRKLQRTVLRAEHRVKAKDSILGKLKRKSQDFRINRIFNDILSIRILVDSYPSFRSIPDCFRMVDYVNDLKRKSGYRGIHIYYRENNNQYPIEIQINSFRDRLFNDWMHIETYKKGIPNHVQEKLRGGYEAGRIKNIEDFRKGLYELLRSS